ncbi:hypothetical protein F4818DRAFT_427873 [Hypoxylon cercidicola]|nr:hypothetical protein F4818DRAFT_427873 [Hypoxylon cercidicola]
MAGAVLATVAGGGFRGGPSVGRPNEPVRPNPFVYNPKRWARVAGDYFDKGAKDRDPFKQRQDLKTPTGWLTWNQQEEQYPALDTILKSRELRPEDMWNLRDRSMKELEIKDPTKRPRLEPDIITKLSIERGFAAELPEMNPLYRDYSQIPAILPPKLSNEQMRRPLPVPPRLVLAGPSGPEIDVKAKPAPKTPVRKNWQKAVERYDPETQKMKLPAPKFEYAPDRPETSTFKFADGRGVGDIFKPTPPDEHGQVRVSQQLTDYGLQEAERQRALKVPYTYPTVDPRPPAGFKFNYPAPTPRSEEEKKARRERAAREAAERMRNRALQLADLRQREAAGWPGDIPVAGRPGVFVDAAYRASRIKKPQPGDVPNVPQPSNVPGPPGPPAPPTVPQPKKAVRFDIPGDE